MYHHISTNNPYFQPVTQKSKNDVLQLLDNFEGSWICGMENAPTEEGRLFYQNYDYDRTTLDEDDYYYIQTRDADHPMENYDLYIFDVQQNILYFFHSAA